MFPGIQEWVHRFEEGAGVRYVKIGALILVVLTLFAIYDLREWKGFSTAEAMDTAQVARNISRGEGFTTSLIRPLSVHLIEKRSTVPSIEVLEEPHPDLANAPVYPLLLAALLKVVPLEYDIASDISFTRYQPEMAITFLNQGLFLLAAFLIFTIGRRLFDRGVGLLAALLFLTTDLFWRFSVSGLSTMLLAVIFLGIVWCIILLEAHERTEQHRVGRAIGLSAATGALVALGGLTRYSFAWMLLPVLVFLLVYVGRRRWLVSSVAVVTCLLLMTPWLIRNHQLSGTWFGTSGYAMYEGTQHFQGNRLERMLGPELETDLGRVSFEHIVRKLVVNSGEILQNQVIQLGGNWLSAFFLVGLLIPFRSPSLNPLRVFALSCLAVFIVVQAGGQTHLTALSPAVNSENLLPILAPLIFVFGAGAFFVLLDQTYFPLPQLRFLAVFLFGIVASAPLLYTLAPPLPANGPIAYPPYNPRGIQYISRFLEGRELMMSDMPWAVAWYGDRRCVWVTTDAPLEPTTASKSDFFKIHDYHDRVKGLYLTLLTTDARFFSDISRDPDYAWGQFMVEVLAKRSIPKGFPLTHSPARFVEEGQVFLSDYPRWNFSSSKPAAH